MNTARLWREYQGSIPEDHTVNPVIIATDATHVTNFSGDGKMHPAYISSGQINKAVRNKPSRNAFMMFALFPVCKFADTEFETITQQKEMPGRLRMRVFHICMRIALETIQPAQYKSVEMIDPEGNVRWTRIFLGMIIADNLDKSLIATLNQNFCIQCMAETNDLG
ncbi:hypothetical protein AURDEDRAFT_38213, partial [Auricularia subglabra TFB-10046 SS5]